MKQFREKVLEQGSACNPLLALAEAGVSPAEIKTFVIKTLSPYLRDRGILEELAIEVFAAQAVNFLLVNADSLANVAFHHVLSVYRQAESKDSEASYRGCAESEPLVASSLADYWSALYLQQPKSELDLPELKYEVFRNIGPLIEAQLQPLLRDLLVQVRIARGKAGTRFSEIQSLSLGGIVVELYKTAGHQELFAPSPWHILLSQWRNIAQHHGSSVEGNEIRCFYGALPRQREVRLTKEDLGLLHRRIAATHRAIKLARALFFVDNAEKIEKYMPPLDVRDDAVAFSFVAAVSTQGFRVIDMAITKEAASAVLCDIVETDKKRLIHASQLLLPLWTLTQRSSLMIFYKDKEGIPRMSFQITGEACSRLSTGEIDIPTYLTFVDFRNISPS